MTVPAVVIRPIELAGPLSPGELVNHSAPSGPEAIASGVAMLGAVKFVTLPVVVIRPIELLALFVNHSAPSAPRVMPVGRRIPGPV